MDRPVEDIQCSRWSLREVRAARRNFRQRVDTDGQDSTPNVRWVDYPHRVEP